MTYTVYTKKSTVAYPVVFKCECCGKYSAEVNLFTVEASYSTKGTLTQKGVDKRERQADESIRVQKANLLDKIIEDTYNRKVKNTGYVCVCSHCGTVPKWSKFHNQILDKACQIINYLSVLILAFLLLGDGWTPWFLLPIGMLAAANIPQFILYASKTLKVKKMNEEYLPIVCENAEELKGILQKIALNQKVSVKVPHHNNPAAMSSVGEGWVCICGKKHAAYVSSCTCGRSKTAAKLQNRQNE